MNDLFVNASRLKLRFDTKQGQLSTEDLWDLPLLSTRANVATLDDLAVTLNTALTNAGTTSFVKKATRPNEILKLKFDVVLHVIEVKQAEEEAAELKKTNAYKKQQILEIIARKETDDLAGKSTEELRQLVAAL